MQSFISQQHAAVGFEQEFFDIDLSRGFLEFGSVGKRCNGDGDAGAPTSGQTHRP